MIYKYFLCLLFIADISEADIFSSFSRQMKTVAMAHMSSDQIGRVLDVKHAYASIKKQMIYLSDSLYEVKKFLMGWQLFSKHSCGLIVPFQFYTVVYSEMLHG